MKHIREHAQPYEPSPEDLREMGTDFAWSSLLEEYRNRPEIEDALRDIKQRIEATWRRTQ